ncbi:MAG TPA: winged helix-turn-helix domain-containing protein [Thermoplasmata archaeon]|nr:winged helix-turn-helix domain-containing protein [Thermoplasmata archaeon]
MTERPDLFVVGRLLEALAAGPLLKTPLQQRAGLNYTVFQRYLDLLLRLGLVAGTPTGDGRIALTSKGQEAHRFIAEGLARIFSPSAPRSDLAAARVRATRDARRP